MDPLRAVLGEDSAGFGELPEPCVRHHVSLERATRQAASGRLFQNRVTAAGYDLRFRGELTATHTLTSDEEGLLDAAVQITDQIGGGRGRGLGLVKLRIESQTHAEEAAAPPELPPETSAITLVLSVEEPLQLGLVKDLSNVAASKDYLDGSAVRGAVAAALERIGLADKHEPLLGRDDPAHFGNGYPGHVAAITAPMTLREPKKGGRPVDDALRLCADVAGGRKFSRVRDRRAAKGSFAPACTGWAKVRVKRRMVTRTARNLVDGRAADGMLFSLEVVEPTLEPSPCASDARLRFYVPVSGRREQLAWVVEAAAAGLVVGSTRTRGFGRLRLCEVRTDPPFEPLPQRHERWAERLRSLGVERPERTGVLLALGPLAVDPARLLWILRDHGLELRHGVSRRGAHGGWNARARLPRGVASHYLPGSTFIVESADGASALPALTAIENLGIGPGRPDGWGRMIACHPIHIDCCEEDRA